MIGNLLQKNNLLKKDNLIVFIFIFIGLIVCLIADDYLLYVATSWLIFGILGLSLDLLWGKAGILSLGQTIFYGLGGYAGAVTSINFSSTIGNTFILALPIGIFVGVLTAGIIGYFIFYGRMGELQTTILTYAAVLVAWTSTLTFSYTFGEAKVAGDNGLSNIPSMILSFGEGVSELSEKGMFLSLLLISVLLLIGCQRLIKMPFGKVIECIRQDSHKTELLGYDIRKYQTILFMISGGIAGLGGALFALWGNYLNPSMFSVTEALLVPIYVLVGGIGTLVGPFLGAISIGALSFYLGGFSGGQATLVIGIILILMVLFFDKGIMGIILSIVNKFIKKPFREEAIEINIGKYNIAITSRWKKIRTDQVFKSFGGVIPVNNIDLEFNAGTTCIIGPNGAGKSSFLKVCTGIYPIDNGKVFLDSLDITNYELHDRVKQGIGIKMQKPQVFKSFSIKENIWISAYSKTRNVSLTNKTTNDLLEIFGGKKQGHRSADSLSHGEQQWLDIIMVLALEPSVICLDEPAAGMTKGERRKLSTLINILSKTRTIILVEHDMDFVKSLNPKVAVLHQGSLFTTGNIDEVCQNENVLDIYLGRK